MISGRNESKHGQHLFRRIEWKELDLAYIEALVRSARAEDIDGAGLLFPPARPGDPTTDLLDPKRRGSGNIVARVDMVICGLSMLPIILKVYGNEVAFTTKVKDGDRVNAGQCLASFEGSVTVLLSAERIMLNFLQHLSGIATQTFQYVSHLGESPTRILDTRKTTPGFRVLEKYAVRCGGGWNHRMGLFDRIMLKDNHLAADESVTGEALARLIQKAKRERPDLAVEVEVDSLEQLSPVLQSGADVILLDNFDFQNLEKAVEWIGKRAYTEASGGITIESLPAMGRLGLDFISCGSLIHQSRWVDIGLDWNRTEF